MTAPRVVIADDQAFVRIGFRMILSSGGIEVVGEAADGKRGIELCEQLRPDVVTMDMMLPVMSGLSATEYIMAHVPTPILVVSSSLNRGELYKTYDALAAGAVDVLDKPTGDEPDGDWEARLLATVKLVSRIRARIREDCSPRHVPDEIRAVPAIPRTLSGKALEVPVKRILSGEPVERTLSRDALADPEALRPFEELARSAEWAR